MFPPGIIKDVRCTVRENISITRQTKRLSSVTCCKGLPMKHCAILSHRVPQPGKCHVRIQIFPGQPIHRHQLAAGAQLAAQRRKVEERFSPSRIRQIKKGLKNGAQVREARTKEEILCLPRCCATYILPRYGATSPASSSFSISKTS